VGIAVAGRVLAAIALSPFMVEAAWAYLDVGTPGDQLICGLAAFTSDPVKIVQRISRECKAGDVLFVARPGDGSESLPQELPALLCDFSASIIWGAGSRSLNCIYRGSPRGERHPDSP